MTLIRLGDRMDESSLQARKPYFRAADALAQKIFDPILGEDKLDEY